MTPRRRNAEMEMPAFSEDQMGMSDERKVTYGRDHLTKLIKNAEQLGYTFEYDGENYPEYVHDLWLTLTKTPMLKEHTKTIEHKLGYGDTIQLFSDTLQDLYATEFKES